MIEARLRPAAVAVVLGLTFALVVIGPTLALGVPSTRAATRTDPRSLQAEPVGSLAYTWVADPARGCTAEGLCGVSGSLTIRVGNSSSGGGSGLPPIDLDDQDAVARSSETGGDGETFSCADPEPIDLTLAIHRARAVVLGSQSPAPPSSGRCAGPTASDLAQLVLPAHREGGHAYDLAGQDTFYAGPFDVEVSSTLRVLLREQSIPPLANQPKVPKLRSALEETAQVTYRLTGAEGSLRSSFTGVDQPFCEATGTCGAQGTAAFDVRPSGETLTFFGSRLVRHRVGARAALGDLRAGRLHSYTNSFLLSLPATTTASWQIPFLPACIDTASTDTGLGSTISDHTVALELSGDFIALGADPFRTRCPGPLAADIDSGGDSASGSVPLTKVGDGTLTIRLSTAGSFTGGGYQGSRSGALTLELVRTAQRGGTDRVRVRGGLIS